MPRPHPRPPCGRGASISAWSLASAASAGGESRRLVLELQGDALGEILAPPGARRSSPYPGNAIALAMSWAESGTDWRAPPWCPPLTPSAASEPFPLQRRGEADEPDHVRLTRSRMHLGEFPCGGSAASVLAETEDGSRRTPTSTSASRPIAVDPAPELADQDGCRRDDVIRGSRYESAKHHASTTIVLDCGVRTNKKFWQTSDCAAHPVADNREKLSRPGTPRPGQIFAFNPDGFDDAFKLRMIGVGKPTLGIDDLLITRLPLFESSARWRAGPPLQTGRASIHTTSTFVSISVEVIEGSAASIP